MDKEEVIKWANETLDKFREEAFNAYLEDILDSPFPHDKESFIAGYYKGYIKAKSETK